MSIQRPRFFLLLLCPNTRARANGKVPVHVMDKPPRFRLLTPFRSDLPHTHPVHRPPREDSRDIRDAQRPFSVQHATSPSASSSSSCSSFHLCALFVSPMLLPSAHPIPRASQPPTLDRLRADDSFEHLQKQTCRLSISPYRPAPHTRPYLARALVSISHCQTDTDRLSVDTTRSLLRAVSFDITAASSVRRLRWQPFITCDPGR
mmetsp:Transcript_39398/g.121839  ORF Transcript_39398/g.121839 Transcript_39398/m.121839 type:complete len:205 (+) Transcript_39398:625-1239(+)